MGPREATRSVAGRGFGRFLEFEGPGENGVSESLSNNAQDESQLEAGLFCVDQTSEVLTGQCSRQSVRQIGLESVPHLYPRAPRSFIHQEEQAARTGAEAPCCQSVEGLDSERVKRLVGRRSEKEDPNLDLELFLQQTQLLFEVGELSRVENRVRIVDERLTSQLVSQIDSQTRIGKDGISQGLLWNDLMN